MKAKCASCPFRDGGDDKLAANVLRRNGLSSSQICHHPRLKGKKETHLCRGARDIQLGAMAAMKLIDEPTDEAFENASRALGVEPYQITTIDGKRNR